MIETRPSHAAKTPLPKPWYSGGLTTLYLGDCVETLARMPENSIDCIFADPPYRLSNGGISCHAGKVVSVNKGGWDKSEGIDADHEANLEWLAACRRVLHPNGSIWVSGTSHIIFSVGFALQSLGFRILNDIVWYKPNASPNLSCRYFTHSHETLLWAAKSVKSRHCFNYQAMRHANHGKQMRSLWTFERGSDLDDVWAISTPRPSEKTQGKHPTQKPLALLERVIAASTDESMTVLDPFVGSGTTCIAAMRLGRRSIGIDESAEFLDLARRRIAGDFPLAGDA